MNDNRFDLLCEVIHKLSASSNCDDMKKIVFDFENQLEAYNDDATRGLVDDVKSIAKKLVCSNEKSDLAGNSDRGATLTESEREELAEANRVIDNNLFDYHFQPIVSAVDGKIFSFEALMRPESELCPSPYHILKYADYSNRLEEIEKETFLNILPIVEKNKEKLKGRLVFINSIPKTKLPAEDVERINELLARNSNSVVVEMTEQSELSEQEFSKTKDRYNRLNVKIAVDDYGTGYANVKNLLEYMPSFVKIDHSLINNIHNDKKKRHFVREIIEFCHDNKIVSLAEGVETAEELRTVIRLGVDLIQGFYTSNPSPEFIDKIPYEIRQEIKLYHQEYESGKDMHIYYADNDERVFLDRLDREEYKRVVIGKEGNCNVTLVGTPGVELGIYVDILKGFSGKITIENIDLISDKNNPIFTIGENCDVILEFIGQNHLRKSGIKVPENARLVCCGSGNLYIYVDGLSFFGIGNDADSKHGELVFEKGVAVENNSASGICIGAGLGGRKIRINNGKFDLRMTGNYGVAIGSFDSDVDIDILASDMAIDLSVPTAVGIGSFKGQCFANVKHSYISVSAMGVEVAGIGTLDGQFSKTKITEAKTIMKIAGERCTGIGAVNGRTEFVLEKAGATMTCEGERALALGGFTKDTDISLINADVTLTLASEKVNYLDYYNRDNVHITGGRTRFTYNEEIISD